MNDSDQVDQPSVASELILEQKRRGFVFSAQFFHLFDDAKLGEDEFPESLQEDDAGEFAGELVEDDAVLGLEEHEMVQQLQRPAFDAEGDWPSGDGCQN